MSIFTNLKRIRIRAFRAPDDVQACERYIEGHKKILEVYGVSKVTSSGTEWINDFNTYVIIVESKENDKVLGGGRIQVGSSKFALPIEGAVGELDESIFRLVEKLNKNGTGELCGLWNSVEVAGLGIGSVFLGRAGVSIVTQIGLSSLFALCASTTIKNCLGVGFLVEESLGNRGTFYYPKLDLIATAMLLKDPAELSSANLLERERILELRKEPQLIVVENGRKGPIEIEFDLQVPHYQKY